MKIRGWEGWFVASFLADVVAALFAAVVALRPALYTIASMPARRGSRYRTPPYLHAP
jgi:hypothetical protein